MYIIIDISVQIVKCEDYFELQVIIYMNGWWNQSLFVLKENAMQRTSDMNKKKLFHLMKFTKSFYCLICDNAASIMKASDFALSDFQEQHNKYWKWDWKCDDDIDDEMSESCEHNSPSILVVMHTLFNLLWNIGLVFAPKVSRV